MVDVLRRPLSPRIMSERRIRQGMIAFRLERRLAMGPSSALPFAATDPEESRRRIRDRVFYHEISVVRGVRATWDGGLWIQRHGEDPWDDDGPIDVFAADREYVASAVVPLLLPFN